MAKLHRCTFNVLSSSQLKSHQQKFGCNGTMNDTGAGTKPVPVLVLELPGLAEFWLAAEFHVIVIGHRYVNYLISIILP